MPRNEQTKTEQTETFENTFSFNMGDKKIILKSKEELVSSLVYNLMRKRGEMNDNEIVPITVTFMQDAPSDFDKNEVKKVSVQTTKIELQRQNAGNDKLKITQTSNFEFVDTVVKMMQQGHKDNALKLSVTLPAYNTLSVPEKYDFIRFIAMQGQSEYGKIFMSQSIEDLKDMAKQIKEDPYLKNVATDLERIISRKEALESAEKYEKKLEDAINKAKKSPDGWRKLEASTDSNEKRASKETALVALKDEIQKIKREISEGAFIDISTRMLPKIETAIAASLAAQSTRPGRMFGNKSNVAQELIVVYKEMGGDMNSLRNIKGIDSYLPKEKVSPERSRSPSPHRG